MLVSPGTLAAEPSVVYAAKLFSFSVPVQFMVATSYLKSGSNMYWTTGKQKGKSYRGKKKPLSAPVSALVLISAASSRAAILDFFGLDNHANRALALPEALCLHTFTMHGK